ncbi:Rpr2 domain containing protein [Pyrenophora tritici-repentis]|uniref:RNAse P Rpr2/Rpp21/SNM1 protein n=1 Tax=Pyrenophora tritici-repentis TaxID=45151 RepID=A0A2W1HMI3_9PLEO|nr:RNAse P Rpr2-Rpp21-SNM1 subunit domain-containing protein [Pyrenophora tritici-repentis]KAF7453825.1 RNAse P Rpr2-Rpp21-SNM1 protein [Pyrenophora tritici-repentis]KAF7576918.1 hypothetical protein PtrM4_011580 [Pyrenophora tritici-repentis]KAI0584604.1 RNAse P Rpr2-Rpp21-SNM1 subunit domain-containing protein [Pyrenophora tritici-repentis]KAI1520697.1 RNAse P Rpr2/Rpp21/SNM1 protein [Pyrenophora tritici-repentis]
MAAADSIQLKAKFLQESAHLLAVSSPTTAASLGQARNRLVEDAELQIASKESDAFRRGVCGACGNIMIPGWSCQVSKDPHTKYQEKKDKAKTNQLLKPNKSIRYTCLRCHRETHQDIQQRPRRQNRKSATSLDTELVTRTRKSTNNVSDPAPKTLNATSKQRQKARRGGLQAMLEKKKTEASSMSGLDFMDFAM